ncbi:MAG: NifU N-terminal domain-containing protein [Acidimicrobiia bacterium]|nr:NifU N-terminal domain-containing protein [Acidimicrobiia bacterium]
MVSVDPTPNPNALKFTVGKPVGGPSTFVAGKETDDPLALGLLALDGVTSVFLTADFVTVSKSADASWDGIADAAAALIGDHFD